MDALKFLQEKYPDKEFQLDQFGRIGFIHEDFFITDPTTTDCGRFEVKPPEEYGVSWFTAMMMVSHNKPIEDLFGDLIWET